MSLCKTPIVQKTDTHNNRGDLDSSLDRSNTCRCRPDQPTISLSCGGLIVTNNNDLTDFVASTGHNNSNNKNTGASSTTQIQECMDQAQMLVVGISTSLITSLLSSKSVVTTDINPLQPE